MKRNTLYALVGGLLVGALFLSYSRANRFEERARDAERFNSEQKHVIKVLRDDLADAQKRIERGVRNIVETDTSNPPPDSCKPNLVARDKVIADQRAALLLAGRVNTSLQASNDTLAAALHARPGALLRLPFLTIGQPKLGAFAGISTTGKPVAGVGVTIPISLGGN